MTAIAREVSMFVKNQLGHTHYFHSPPKRRDQLLLQNTTEFPKHRSTLNLFVIILIVILLLAILFTGGTSNVWQVCLFVTAFSAVIGFIISLNLLLDLRFANQRHSADRVLLVTPTQLQSPEPGKTLKDLYFHKDRVVGKLKAVLPQATAAAFSVPERPALGQMRRGYLKISEMLADNIGNAKAIDKKGNDARRWVFWLTLTFSTFAFLTSFLIVILENDVVISPLIAFIILPLFPIFWAIYSLLRQVMVEDLPKIKLLRSAHGFFSAVDPTNFVIRRVMLAEQATKMSRDSVNFGDHLEDDASISFVHVRQTIETQIEGESQRMETRRHWLGMLVGMLGAFVAAISILYFVLTKLQDDRNLAERHDKGAVKFVGSVMSKSQLLCSERISPQNSGNVHGRPAYLHSLQVINAQILPMDSEILNSETSSHLVLLPDDLSESMTEVHN